MNNQPTPEPTIKRLDLNDPVVKREFLRILARINKQFKPLTDAIRESQRITAKDLAITITNQERRK